MSAREELGKNISFKNYLSIGLGTMIGMGWVMYAGQWLHDAGPFGAAIAFILCGLLLLPIGACYAELTSALPVAGGEVAFTYKAFGPMTSFLTAWALGLNYVALTPFETIAIGTLTAAILPEFQGAPLYSVDGFNVSWLTLLPGLVLGAVIIRLNYLGSKQATEFQTLVIYLLLICVAIFSGTALIKGDFSNLLPMFSREGSFWAVAPASIISVLVVAPWFMAGFDTIPQAAEESGKDMEPRQLGIAILASILLGAVFYVLIVFSVALCMPQAELTILISNPNIMPTAEIFRAAFGYEWMTKLVLFSAMLGLITTLNGVFIASSRLLFSLGRGGMLPRWFAKVHPCYGTPSNSVLFVGVVSMVGPFIGKAALGPIVSSSSLAFTIAMLMTALASIRLRKLHPELERPYSASITTLGMAAAIALMLLLLMVTPGSPGQLESLEFMILSVWMFLGVIAYVIRQFFDGLDQQTQGFMILGQYRS